jgi:hypothetical protein
VEAFYGYGDEPSSCSIKKTGYFDDCQLLSKDTAAWSSSKNKLNYRNLFSELKVFVPLING